MEDDSLDFVSYPTAADATLADNLYIAGTPTSDALLSGLSTLGTDTGTSFVNDPSLNAYSGYTPSTGTGSGSGNITINNGTSGQPATATGIAGALSSIGNSIG